MNISQKILIAALTLGLTVSPLALAKTSDTEKAKIEKVKAHKVSTSAAIKDKTSKEKAKAKSKAKKKAQITTSYKMVNINKATKQQLVSVLSGIGEKKAKAIVDYRNKHGAFKFANDLLKVKGIGKKILAKNKTKISLKGKTVVGHSDKVKKAKSSKKKLVTK